MFFKIAIGLVLCTHVIGGVSDDWNAFKNTYHKRYESVKEEAQRQQIFMENVHRMREYQAAHPDASFSMAINHLADRRVDELVPSSNSFAPRRSPPIWRRIEPIAKAPPALDWREKKVISPVVDQGIQPKVAAIGAVEMIESYQAIRTQKLEQGSYEQVDKCCPETIDVLDCVLKKMDGRICRRNDFNASVGTCDKPGCQPYAQFKAFRKLGSVDEETMVAWIQDSPLLVGIDASQMTFQFYNEGVYKDVNCSKTAIDHVMQVVGYGSEAGQAYWLCKNSWGPNWGDQGYIRIERGTNTCGIATNVMQITSHAGRMLFNVYALFALVFSLIVTRV